jgi:putative membrane protein
LAILQTPLQARSEGATMGFEWIKPAAMLGSIVYALIGVLVFWLSFIVIDKITPYNLWEEIVEKQNMALGMVVAAMCLGISVIVAAAIH